MRKFILQKYFESGPPKLFKIHQYLKIIPITCFWYKFTVPDAHAALHLNESHVVNTPSHRSIRSAEHNCTHLPLTQSWEWAQSSLLRHGTEQSYRICNDKMDMVWYGMIWYGGWITLQPRIQKTLFRKLYCRWWSQKWLPHRIHYFSNKTSWSNITK